VSVSVARRVAFRGALLLVGTLIVVGVATGVVLHKRAVDALDQALVAAAHGNTHPEVTVGVEVEHSASPVEAWLVKPGDVRVPAAAAADALRTEHPVFLDLGDRRLFLLPFEIDDDTETPALAAAAAPRITLARSVGPFALAYAIFSAAAAALALLVQSRVVRSAFRPLAVARAEVRHVIALGEGRQLTETGPVEVRALVVAVNDLLTRLDAAHDAQARFTAEAAHELRTPVAAMLGELDVTLRSPRTAEAYREALVSTREEVARLSDLVGGLTALARIDAGQVDRDRARVRAGEIAAAALARESRALTAAHVPPTLIVAADPELDAHPALLEVAVANLLRNVARHAPNAPVTVTVDRDGERARFIIDDHGPGVPPEAREPLFDRFARSADARQRDRGGLGLGLPIAREVARRHGGDCQLDRAPSGGLRAILTLRALPAAPTEPVDAA